MIEDKMPVFVCQQCGNIIRAVAYEELDIYNCRICGFEMTKTSVWLNDSEYNEILNNRKLLFDFRKNLYDDYVQGNEFFDGNMSRKRLDEEMRNFNQQMYGG